MTDLPMSTPRPYIPQILMTLFLRLAALGCLWYGLELWGALIGYSEHGAGRFDLLGTDMKTARATLAVLYPVAAIGLWLRGAWGPVIWAVTAGMEIAMHQVFADTFGADPVKIVAIGLTVVIYLALRLTLLLVKPPKPLLPQG